MQVSCVFQGLYYLLTVSYFDSFVVSNPALVIYLSISSKRGSVLVSKFLQT